MNSRLQIIATTTRPGRSSNAIAHWALSLARKHGEFLSEIVDLAEVGLPIFDEPVSPCLRQYVGDHTRRWSAIVDSADAFIFIMAEYNHGYTASIKNALDYLYYEWQYKPVGFISYGGPCGGTRAVESIMPVVVSLGMTPVRHGIAVPFVSAHVDNFGRFLPTEPMEAKMNAMLGELSAFSGSLAGLRVSSLSDDHGYADAAVVAD
jgi:NAD(P)H-dependent FMN reductase